MLSDVQGWRGPHAVAVTALAAVATACVSRAAPVVTPVVIAPVAVVAPPPPPPEVVGAEYRRRFPVATASDKVVSNTGTGDDALYGTRNVRAVLNGVYYRGGANNAYHRDRRRHNSNPLPDDGLANLCRQGFGTALYMYPTRFQSAAPVASCEQADGRPGQLTYRQISVLRGRKDDLRRIIAEVFAHVREPARGPIYVHCWNGWHASGYAAAATLRQLCGFSAEQAVRYWNLNTDGVNGKAYDKVRTLIRNFEPFPEFSLTAEEQAALCPDPETLTFRAAPPAGATGPSVASPAR